MFYAFVCIGFVLSLIHIGLMQHQKKEEGDLPFGIEDLLYYVKKVQEQEFDLDFVALKEYFPVNLVLPGIFKIVQDLFGNYTILCCLEFPNFV